MQTLQQIVYAAQPWRLNGTGKYFRVLSNVEAIDVRMFNMGRVTYEAKGVEAGFYVMPDGGFDAVEVVATANPQLVKVAISDGAGGYDRYSGTVNLATAASVVNNGLVNVPAATTQLVLAADASRKGIRFLNSGATVVYLGGAGVDLASGCLKLNAGDLWVEGDAPGAAWYAYSDGGAGALKVQTLI